MSGSGSNREGAARKVGLIVLDGWGLRETREANAVALARTPCFDSLREKYPRTTLSASGRAVGLRDGMMGNSEVGHLNLGAGRVVKQDILRIDDAIESGDFFDNEALLGAVDHVRGTDHTLHLMGLVSDGGVHSHLDHLVALLELARREDLDSVAVHAFTDGRDTSPTAGVGYLTRLQESIEEKGVGAIATVVGRYYAMDRDRRWDRTRCAYEAIVDGRAALVTGRPIDALRSRYEKDETDEFVKPIVVEATPRVSAGDAIVFFNFRADRARQLTRALTDPDFDGFDRDRVEDLHVVQMTEYDEAWTLPTAFGPKDLVDIAAEVWQGAGLTTLRIAETEKYAHVTYFFNGGREEPFDGEQRCMVPSPKVATYDLQPEMSAPGVTDEVVTAYRDDGPDVLVLNFANPDMVGHTGDLEAAIRAVETVDGCLGRVVDAFREAAPDGALLIIADHGNAERMAQDDGSPHTAHTTSPVPCLLVSADDRGPLREGGALCDVVPTLLALQGIDAPPSMTGRDLREG